jgi:hypothetical protein
MNNFSVGDYCMFNPLVGHPVKGRKLGYIPQMSTKYFQDDKRYVNIVIEDVYGKWEIKDQLNDHGHMGISGADWNNADEKDVEYFKKPIEYFQNILPNKLKVNTTLHTTDVVNAAKAILEPTKRDLLVFEGSLISYLLQLEKIFDIIAYSYPNTLKYDEDRYTNADSKQGAYYATKYTYWDIIYQPRLSWQSVKNRSKGLKEYVDSPRNVLWDSRGTELRLAIVLYGETISDWIDCGICGDETPIDEKSYVDMLKDVDRIVNQVITF